MKGDIKVMADLITALMSSLSGTASSILGALGSILPIALPVMGGLLAVNLGIRFFKRSVK